VASRGWGVAKAIPHLRASDTPDSREGARGMSLRSSYIVWSSAEGAVLRRRALYACPVCKNPRDTLRK
jgi:hypothetical protein